MKIKELKFENSISIKQFYGMCDKLIRKRRQTNQFDRPKAAGVVYLFRQMTWTAFGFVLPLAPSDSLWKTGK